MWHRHYEFADGGAARSWGSGGTIRAPVPVMSYLACAAAEYSALGSTAPTSTRPSSVNSTVNSLDCNRCPLPHAPLTLGRLLMNACACWSCCALSPVAGAFRSTPLATTTEVQPEPTTWVCGGVPWCSGAVRCSSGLASCTLVP